MDTEAETEAPARSLNCVEAEAAAGTLLLPILPSRERDILSLLWNVNK